MGEFQDEFGGDGELYGRPEDLISRPGTPSTFATMADVGLYTGGAKERDGEETRRTSATRLGDENENEESSGTGQAGDLEIQYERGY